MDDINAIGLLHIVAKLQRPQAIFEGMEWKEHPAPDRKARVDQEVKVRAIQFAEETIAVLSPLKLTFTLAAVNKLKYHLESDEGFSWNELIKAHENIESRLRDEIDGVRWLSIPASNAKYYDAEKLFGSEVALSFPTASYDIEEAGKCLALRRSTACVMHLMRILEIGLQCLAEEVGVPFENNWNHLIDQIERVIPIYTTKTHGVADEQWFSEVATHFRFLKNAWRNHAMHVHEKYNEEQAEKIFQSVSSFMQQLATRLSDPIAKMLA